MPFIVIWSTCCFLQEFTALHVRQLLVRLRVREHLHILPPWNTAAYFAPLNYLSSVFLFLIICFGFSFLTDSCFVFSYVHCDGRPHTTFNSCYLFVISFFFVSLHLGAQSPGRNSCGAPAPNRFPTTFLSLYPNPSTMNVWVHGDSIHGTRIAQNYASKFR